MSNKSYDELFLVSQRYLHSVLLKDAPEETPLPEFNLFAAFRSVAFTYLSYIKISKILITCYEQMVHPQKRRLVKKILDGCIGRVLELKSELVQLEFSEFQFLDDILLDAKMVPGDFELPVPRYFLEEKREEEMENRRLVQDTLQAFSSVEENRVKETLKMTVEDAVQIIQNHERARQSRQYFLALQNQRRMEEEERRQFGKKKPKPNITPVDAVIQIQKVWRGYTARKAVALDREEELRLLGMLPPLSLTHEADSCLLHLEKIKKDRHRIQQQHESNYCESLVLIKEDIIKCNVPEMKENLQDRLREYFFQYKEENAEFPKFPAEEEGGSDLIFNPLSPEELEEKKLAEEKKKAEKKDKGKGKKGEKKDKDVPVGFVPKQSNCVPDLKDGYKEYKSIWFRQINENDPVNKHDERIIREEKYKEVELEVRVQIDEIMRAELDRLTVALEKDIGKKGKKGGKKKGKGGKKGKGKGKGKKKEKDLTPNRTLESLVEELVQQNILKSYPKSPLKEFVGDYNYFGSILRQRVLEPVPCLGDIRRVVNEYCILPLGSADIHSKGAFVKSILFAGPPGTGKKTLVHTICTETDAVLFDLSAENIAGKYPGKSGLNMLMHLVSKVGRLLQPTVIFINDAEKTFLKKVPKTDRTDPKRLKKDLPKFMKGIGVDDRLLICGTTCIPFDCDLKGLGSCYQKIIVLSKPDYGCRKALWTELIIKSKGIITTNLDISTLSKISDGYTPLHIKSIVQQVMTERRITYQEKQPLDITDFSSLLPLYFPIYEEEDEAYKVWYLKMPLGKKRIKMLKEQNEEKTEEAGKDKKGKKK